MTKFLALEKNRKESQILTQFTDDRAVDPAFLLFSKTVQPSGDPRTPRPFPLIFIRVTQGKTF